MRMKFARLRSHALSVGVVLATYFACCLIGALFSKGRQILEGLPSEEVVRFADEGRAQVIGLRLASGRKSSETIKAISQITGPYRSANVSHFVPVAEHRYPVLDRQVRELISLPRRARGVIRLRFKTDDREIRRSVQAAADFLTSFVSPRWLPRSEIRVYALETGESRAFASGLGSWASIHLWPGVLDVSTAIHELAHHIEGDHPPILDLAKRFLARRARGGSPERLIDLTGQQNYEPDEIALRANWTTRGGRHYTGKYYGPTLARASATEIITMGMERLYNEPAGFFREDPDHFLFLLLSLHTTPR
jgi:hypothetical protein